MADNKGGISRDEKDVIQGNEKFYPDCFTAVMFQGTNQNLHVPEKCVTWTDFEFLQLKLTFWFN